VMNSHRLMSNNGPSSSRLYLTPADYKHPATAAGCRFAARVSRSEGGPLALGQS
jgi:hypothetical protein